MAIDSPQKRWSMLQLASGASYALVFTPDTAGLSAIERATVLKLYGGIPLASGPISAAITGTLVGATEAQVREGGLTVTATVTNDTLRAAGYSYSELNGSTQYWSSPDSAVTDSATVLDIKALVSPDDWTPAGVQAITAKWVTSGNQRSFSMALTGGGSPGFLIFNYSTNGTAVSNATSDATVESAGATNGNPYGVRVVWKSNDGGQATYTFYTSADFDGVNGTWTQLGTQQTAATHAIYDGTAVYTVGERAGAAFLAGKAHYVSMALSEDGAAAVEWDAKGQHGKTSWTADTGEVWTGQASASVIDGFNSFRQDLIDGVTSAQSEPTGWNTVVRDNESVSSVTRDSDTAYTITWSAASTYDITANEVITVTVPAEVLAASSADVTATPTATVLYVLVGGGGKGRRRYRRLPRYWRDEERIRLYQKFGGIDLEPEGKPKPKPKPIAARRAVVEEEEAVPEAFGKKSLAQAIREQVEGEEREVAEVIEAAQAFKRKRQERARQAAEKQRQFEEEMLLLLLYEMAA